MTKQQVEVIVNKPIYDNFAWKIPCYFIHKDIRRNSVSLQLLKGVIKYEKENGIIIIESDQTTTQTPYSTTNRV